MLLILLDEKGHAEWELAKNLEIKDSNLNPILNKLQELNVIYQEIRPSSREKNAKTKKEKKYKEFPYYIRKNLESLKTIIGEIKSTKSPKKIDPGFFIGILMTSNYAKKMEDEFGKDFYKTITQELVETYEFCKDNFFEKIVSSSFYDKPISRRVITVHKEPTILEPTSYRPSAVLESLLRPSEIERWYQAYISENNP